ncbi:MAG: hypothetical protein ACKO37_03240 [Vampirovibrionales bacterium]
MDEIKDLIKKQRRVLDTLEANTGSEEIKKLFLEEKKRFEESREARKLRATIMGLADEILL